MYPQQQSRHCEWGLKCCERRAAAFLCGLAGLEGFVQRAWFSAGKHCDFWVKRVWLVVSMTFKIHLLKHTLRPILYILLEDDSQ